MRKPRHVLPEVLPDFGDAKLLDQLVQLHFAIHPDKACGKSCSAAVWKRHWSCMVHGACNKRTTSCAARLHAQQTKKMHRGCSMSQLPSPSAPSVSSSRHRFVHSPALSQWVRSLGAACMAQTTGKGHIRGFRKCSATVLLGPE